MKNKLAVSASTALMALLAGCFSMESAPMRPGARDQILLRSSDSTPAEHIVISNSGWYLFNALPLACGNAGENATFPWRFFSNYVSLDLLHGRLMKHAAGLGCHAEEVYVYNDEQVLLSIPGTSLPIPIPYVITYKELQISAVLTKPAAAKGGAK